MAAIIGWGAATAVAYACEGIVWWGPLKHARLLEIRPTGYTTADVHGILNYLGPQRRAAYARFQVLDFGLIFAFTRAMLAMQHQGLRRISGGPVRFAPILPLAYAATDAAEDVVLLALIAAYPRNLEALSRAASRLTSTKFVLIATSFTASVLVAVWGRKQQ